jgi:hypothetical protein
VAPRRGEQIYDVVLSRHGNLAWSGEYWMPVYEVNSPAGNGTAKLLPKKHVYQCIRSGPAVVERGEEIALKSLALTAQTLSWINGGQEKTARLP